MVDNAGDVVEEYLNEGADTVQASVTHTLSANVENLTLTGTASVDGAGNTFDNVVTGNSAANTLTGGAGTDTLIGGSGNDAYYAGRYVTRNLNGGLRFENDTIIDFDSTLGNVDTLYVDSYLGSYSRIYPNGYGYTYEDYDGGVAFTRRLSGSHDDLFMEMTGYQYSDWGPSKTEYFETVTIQD